MKRACILSLTIPLVLAGAAERVGAAGFATSDAEIAGLAPTGSGPFPGCVHLPAQGARLRVIAPGSLSTWLTGTFEDASLDTLRLRTSSAASPTLVPCTSILRLESSVSEHSHAGTGRLIGFVVGAGALVATVGATGAMNDPEFAGAAVVGAAVVGGLGGMLLGWIVGGSIKSPEWTEVPLHGDTRWIPPGSSVRVDASGILDPSLEWVVSSPIADSLHLQGATGTRLSLSLAELESFEVSLGHKPASSTPPRIGCVTGMVAGGVVGGVLESGTTEANYGAGIFLGAAIGAATGWLVGKLLARIGTGESWERIPKEQLSR